VVTLGEIWLVKLDPTVGSEIRHFRSFLGVSPPEMNGHLRTVIVAPMTTGARPAPFRIPITFGGKKGLVLPDPIRTLEKLRLVRRLGAASTATLSAALRTLQEVFA